MENRPTDQYLSKFFDLLKGELGEGNVVYTPDNNSVYINVKEGRIDLAHVSECYIRTKQEVLFEVQSELQKLPMNTDADVMAIAKASKVLADLIRNNTPHE